MSHSPRQCPVLTHPYLSNVHKCISPLISTKSHIALGKLSKQLQGECTKLIINFADLGTKGVQAFQGGHCHERHIHSIH